MILVEAHEVSRVRTQCPEPPVQCPSTGPIGMTADVVSRQAHTKTKKRNSNDEIRIVASRRRSRCNESPGSA
jgi:hypothetical protein